MRSRRIPRAATSSPSTKRTRTRRTAPICMVLEYMNAGSLQDLLSARAPISERLCASVCDAVARGLDELRGRKQIHRDIKPSNILLDCSGHIKISDFGITRELNTIEVANTFVGTLAFMSPERIAGRDYSYASVHLVARPLHHRDGDGKPALRPEPDIGPSSRRSATSSRHTWSRTPRMDRPPTCAISSLAAWQRTRAPARPRPTFSCTSFMLRARAAAASFAARPARCPADPRLRENDGDACSRTGDGSTCLRSMVAATAWNSGGGWRSPASNDNKTAAPARRRAPLKRMAGNAGRETSRRHGSRGLGDAPSCAPTVSDVIGPNLARRPALRPRALSHGVVQRRGPAADGGGVPAPGRWRTLAGRWAWRWTCRSAGRYAIARPGNSTGPRHLHPGTQPPPPRGGRRQTIARGVRVIGRSFEDVPGRMPTASGVCVWARSGRAGNVAGGSPSHVDNQSPNETMPAARSLRPSSSVGRPIRSHGTKARRAARW